MVVVTYLCTEISMHHIDMIRGFGGGVQHVGASVEDDRRVGDVIGIADLEEVTVEAEVILECFPV